MNADDLLAFSARSAVVGAALWPGLVEIDGQVYTATVPEPRMITGLISGGETGEGSLVARVSVDILPIAPPANQPLRWKRPGESAYRVREWWIEDVRKSPIDQEWVISCVVKN